MPGLGLRLDQYKDPRSANFLMRTLAPTDDFILPNYAHWLTRRRALDQGETGTCVGHAGEAFLFHPPVVQVKAGQVPTEWDLYRRCVLLDEFADNDDEGYLPDGHPHMDGGTSTLALMKALQQYKLIGAYYWAWDVETISRFVRMQGRRWAGHLGGPVIVGTIWYSSMFETDEHHRISISPGATMVGGHEWLIVGANQSEELFRMRNSWGRAWGLQGEAFVSFETMRRLLREDGDAVTTNELYLPGKRAA